LPMAVRKHVLAMAEVAGLPQASNALRVCP
jgi:hypothetical protein